MLTKNRFENVVLEYVRLVNDLVITVCELTVRLSGEAALYTANWVQRKQKQTHALHSGYTALLNHSFLVSTTSVTTIVGDF